MSRRRSRSGTPPSHTTNSNDPRDLERRIFVGNLPTASMDKRDLEDLFSSYGKIQALSLFRGYGFVQFERAEHAEAAKAGHNGRIYRGYKLDVNMAAERRQKAQSRPSPPRRHPYGGYGETREPRPRSRSPMHGRDSRDHRDGRDLRDPGREPRPGPPRDPRPGPPRDHDLRESSYDRYRGSEGRERDPRDAHYRDDGYDHYYRADDYYRKKEDPYADRYREPWNGRREPEDDRIRPEERRRNELYRQYYEELQRRYDSERPVDCSVIVVNKQQKVYAENVGRKVRDLGMVVDLIFLNTEVSLTQALEDVSRARTPFAIIITQQHEVHRSCTVNILFGTPQEHRNMPMQDAMVLVASNYDSFKIAHRSKEREEIARKAAKMADDVLMREHEREGHPVSQLTAITLLSEGRYLTMEELDGLIGYLQDKRDRLFRATGETHAVPRPGTAPVPLEPQPAAQPMPTVPHTVMPTHNAHLAPAPSTVPASSHQQELQAKILSLFNSGAGAPLASTTTTVQTQGYSDTSDLPSSLSLSTSGMAKMPTPQTSMMSPRPALRPPVSAPSAYGPPTGRMAVPQVTQRPSVTAGTGINFDNPSVQKALDTLIQSGPSINHLVNAGNAAAAQRPEQSMGQAPPMSHYPRHY
ncbi:nuclear receptor coactivator 5 [Chanos chanos]|uniref:Nuclear receptor coactivator 5 n=1 Tax=Chanos chanos TaxID=29144 RepID=A0A6J2VPY7_CHACN|nr:nuclear receptor coactivator 5 [Chanos chanos]